MPKTKTSKKPGSSRPARIAHLEKIDFRTLADEIDSTAEWLVEPLIPARRSTSIVAAGGEGKSLLVLEIGAALATGQATLGRPAGSPVSVLYIDMEMAPEDLADRLTDLGYDYTNNKKLRKHLHYYQLQSFEPFDTAAGGRQVVALAKKHEAGLVVIDTLAGVIQGEENSADTYRNYARHTGQPLKAEGIAVVRLDHLGKDKAKGPRGSSAKRDDVDVAWKMTATKNGRGLRLMVDKKRMAWVPHQIALQRSRTHPLTHSLSVETLTEEERDLVAQLDDLRIPIEWGRDRAGKALRDAGSSCSSVSLSNALRYRKSRSGQPSRQNT